MLERINDNAYKLDLPSSYGNMSATFNVIDLSLYDVGDLRTNPFEEGGNDPDQLAQTPISNHSYDPLQGIGGAMTRAKTKCMEQALQGLIMEMQAKEAVQNESDALPRLITFLHCVEAKRKR